MGDKGGDNEVGELTAKMAEKYYDQTQPLRNALIGNYMAFLGGPSPGPEGGAADAPMPAGYDVTRNPAYGAGRNMIEDQYSNARLGTIANMPRGGQMFNALREVEQARANSVSDLATQIAQDEYNKLYGMATMAPQQSMGTLSGLAGQQAMANAQQQSGKMGALGDVGLGAGMILSEDK